VNDEEKAAEIEALSAEVESIIKYSHVPARNGEKAKTFTNVGAASSAAAKRCRLIIRLKENLGDKDEIRERNLTALMKRAGIDLGKKAAE